MMLVRLDLIPGTPLPEMDELKKCVGEVSRLLALSRCLVQEIVDR